MAAHDPTVRSLTAAIAAHESWAKTPDRAARTASARAAALDRFEREVDPKGVLPPAERARRAEHARKAYFLRLALKSAQSRRAKAASRKGGTHVSNGAGPPGDPANLGERRTSAVGPPGIERTPESGRTTSAVDPPGIERACTERRDHERRNPRGGAAA